MPAGRLGAARTGVGHRALIYYRVTSGPFHHQTRERP